MNLYDETCFECSKVITRKYSTSFSQGINAFDERFKYPIYAIYGFVRYADEIVDTFHDHDKDLLINTFKQDTFTAIRQGISLNPVLQSFQLVVNQYQIEDELITSFLSSMAMDLEKKIYDYETYQCYIYGSAEVVGLMCLRVFCENNEKLYSQLLPGACRFGAALQKINFLRDLKADYEQRGRIYFPGVDFNNFSEEAKQRIEADISEDLRQAYESIIKLPIGARLGVYIAFTYYSQLFKKIRDTSAGKLLEKRIRIPNLKKLTLYYSAVFKQRLNRL